MISRHWIMRLSVDDFVVFCGAIKCILKLLVCDAPIYKLPAIDS